MFRSIIGIALVPIWWVAFISLALVEERSLERALGQLYLDYMQRVKGRIIPGLPICVSGFAFRVYPFGLLWADRV